MKTIYLIRHSESINNNEINFLDLDDNQAKNQLIPLSLKGEELAKILANDMSCLNIKSVWCSAYERTISTAKYIAKNNNLKINILSKFNERKVGDSNSVDDNFWLVQLQDENVKTPDGESREMVTTRMLSGIYEVLDKMNDDEISVIISHATAITFLLMYWCELKHAELKGKKRWLQFKGKDVINDSFHTPEIFKLMFNKSELIDIYRIEKIGDFNEF